MIINPIYLNQNNGSNDENDWDPYDVEENKAMLDLSNYELGTRLTSDWILLPPDTEYNYYKYDGKCIIAINNGSNILTNFGFAFHTRLEGSMSDTIKYSVKIPFPAYSSMKVKFDNSVFGCYVRVLYTNDVAIFVEK